jgi:hypothetical protein
MALCSAGPCGVRPSRCARSREAFDQGSDRTGRRAARVASKLNIEFELYWKDLVDSRFQRDFNRYDDARRRARSLGFEYIENAQLLILPPEQRLDRLETLVQRGVADDAGARAALLGTEKRPVFRLSKLFEEYEAMMN